jgi:uncharacterized protein
MNPTRHTLATLTPRLNRAVPMRTCAGCRQVVAQALMVRVVAVPSETGPARIFVDDSRRLDGRGAWVHPTRSCVQNAARGGLQRSFRRALDPAALLTWGQTDLAIRPTHPPAGDLDAGGTTLVIATEKS